MIQSELILKLFDAFYMERWNDKLRPMPLIELDKQAHKMIIAYFLGNFEEHNKDFSWLKIIEGGIFELLQRIVITDVKPPIYYKIKSNKSHYEKLNEYVFDQLKKYIQPLGVDFCNKFKSHFVSSDDNINKRILSAAHLHASRWEFTIIENANPNGYEIDKIGTYFQTNMEKYYDLEGYKQLTLIDSYKEFINLCGQLRFQSRWANLHRIPKTSVLGHSLFVALLAYLFSVEIKACPKRIANNFFTGLFHDLPEVLTRDIISPVKKSVKGLDDLIKDIEKEHMNSTVYPLLPVKLKKSIKLFTENEFDTIIQTNGEITKVSSLKINADYNEDKFNPRDGSLVKVADEIAAYLEAREALANGCHNNEFKNAVEHLENKYSTVNIAGIDFKLFINQFKN